MSTTGKRFIPTDLLRPWPAERPAWVLLKKYQGHLFVVGPDDLPILYLGTGEKAMVEQ